MSRPACSVAFPPRLALGPRAACWSPVLRPVPPRVVGTPLPICEKGAKCGRRSELPREPARVPTWGLYWVRFPLKHHLDRCEREIRFKHLTPGTPQADPRGVPAQGCGGPCTAIGVGGSFLAHRHPRSSGCSQHPRTFFTFLLAFTSVLGCLPRKQRGSFARILAIPLGAKRCQQTRWLPPGNFSSKVVTTIQINADKLLGKKLKA